MGKSITCHFCGFTFTPNHDGPTPFPDSCGAHTREEMAQYWISRGVPGVSLNPISPILSPEALKRLRADWDRIDAEEAAYIRADGKKPVKRAHE